MPLTISNSTVATAGLAVTAGQSLSVGQPVTLSGTSIASTVPYTIITSTPSTSSVVYNSQWQGVQTPEPPKVREYERVLHERYFLSDDGIAACEISVVRHDSRMWGVGSEKYRTSLEGEFRVSDEADAVTVSFTVDDVMDHTKVKAELARIRKFRRMIERLEKQFIATITAAKMGVPIDQTGT